MPQRILVIDDQPLNLELIVEVLEAEGFEVRTAVSAEEAAEVLHGYPADLVLVDVQLPAMDGLSFTRQLRSGGGERSSVPVVAVTSYAMEGDRAEAMAAGCSGYLTKPIDTRGLAEYIRQYLPRE